jgi:ABC-2 type transport system permease protein
MVTLLKKEISGFFSSLTGYLVIIIFLVTTGLFLWIIPGDNNLLDTGYANLDGYFMLAPWLFLFLIPAITMRSFSDEKKSGTWELLLTRPISDLSIVLSKNMASLTIALIGILPTLIYFLSVYLLGNPVGNIDTGGTWGSYIGLILLAMVYVSIGGFCSSLTENQVIAFLLTLVVTFVFYLGFETLGNLLSWSKTGFILEALSINRHYISLSRGVIDTRDLVYFFGTSAFFVLLTRFKLQSRYW